MIKAKGKFNLVLYELSDLSAVTPEPEVARYWETLQQIRQWAEDYLTQPHPELGRDGPVCPFASPSMRKGLFYLAVCPGRSFTTEEIQQRLLTYRDRFMELGPHAGQESFFKTILILFPDLASDDIAGIIDRTQEDLKPAYVANGLMLGEFHQLPPQKSGLWNPDFLPLRSPIPMLVIRNMVPTDFLFLKDDPELIRSYLQRFEDQIPPHMREAVRQAALAHDVPVPSLEDMAAVHPEVAKVLEEHGVAVRVHRHRDLPVDPRGPADVAAALGWPLSRITKSLFVRCSCHGNHAVLVTPVDRRVDWGVVAAHFGCLSFELVNPRELGALVGFAPGGVCPIGVGSIPVLIDEQVMSYPTVLVAAGEVAVELEIHPKRLREITDARVLSLVERTLSERVPVGM